MDVMMAYSIVDLIWGESGYLFGLPLNVWLEGRLTRLVYLKMKGVDPDKHEVSTELERVREYYTKIRNIEQPEKRTPLLTALAR